MTAPRSMSLAGCLTRGEARGRFEAWLAEIHRDRLHRLRTDLFAARDDGEIAEDGDLEAIVAAVDDAVLMAASTGKKASGPRWRSSTGC